MAKKKWKMPVILLCAFLLLLVLYLFLKNKNQQEEAAESAGLSVMDLEEASVTGLSFQIDGEKVTFKKSGDQWKNSGDSEFPVNQDKMTDLISDLTGLEAERVLTGIEDLSEYGLEEPVNTVELETSDGTVKKLLVGSQNQGTGSWYLCFSNDLATVYVTASDVSSNLPPSVMDLAEYDPYPEISYSYVNQICVEKSENSYDLVKNQETTDWEVTGDDGITYSAEYQDVNSLVSTLADLSYSGLADYNAEDLAVYGLEEPAASVYLRYEEEVEEEEEEETSEDSSESDSSQEEEEPEMIEKDLTLYIGDQTEEGDYYVCLAGSSQVNTVSSDTLSSLLDSTSVTWWDLAAGYEYVKNIRSVEVTYQGEIKTIEREVQETEDEDGDTRETVTYSSGGTTLDEEKAEDFLYEMVGINAQSKDPALSSSQSPEISMTVTAEEQTFTVTYAPYDENFYLLVDSEGRPGLVNKNDVKELIEKYQAVWS